MQNTQIFKDTEFGTLTTILKDGEPWFVGKEIATALGYRNKSDAISTHCEGVVKRYSLETKGGKQNIRIINESDMYSLIFSSKLGKAKRFKKWVTGTVLPSIRKNGIYATPVTLETMIADPEWAIGLLQTLKAEQQQRAIVEEQRDEAIRTKALIGSRREAQAMNTASQAVRKANKLEIELDKSREFLTVKRMTIEHPGTEYRWQLLKSASTAMNKAMPKVQDQNYGKVNSYHRDVWMAVYGVSVY